MPRETCCPFAVIVKAAPAWFSGQLVLCNPSAAVSVCDPDQSTPAWPRKGSALVWTTVLIHHALCRLDSVGQTESCFLTNCIYPWRHGSAVCGFSRRTELPSYGPEAASNIPKQPCRAVAALGETASRRRRHQGCLVAISRRPCSHSSTRYVIYVL